MKHLDLFSGIGGFAIATENVWDNVEHIFCDNDPFSQAVLKKHWPNSLIYGDIKELTGERITTDTRREYGEPWSSEGAKRHTSKRGGTTSEAKRHSSIDILTGGFPCQPFSAAGQRRGTEDDRHLWPEMLRVIRETNPTYILGENVGGLLTWDGGLVFEQVCTDLESEGYEVGAFVIPACALNAPHRRDRVWIVAHANTDEYRGRAGQTREENEIPSFDREEICTRKFGGTSWDRPWVEVAAKLCALDDGLRYNVVGLDGRTNAEVLPRPKGWRNAALKGAGNAIVPQVAAQILRAMRNVDVVV
jgi:DNA (cytosine-5)-methyltransferase 1